MKVLEKYDNRNSKEILKNLYFYSGLSRGAISKMQNVTVAMTSIICGKMIEDDLLIEKTKENLPTKTGPKEKALFINGDFALVLGVYIERGMLSCGITNLTNKVLFSDTLSTENLTTSEILSIAKKTCEKFLKKIDKNKLLGMGVCVIGKVENGVSVNTYGVLEENTNLQKYFEDAFDISVAVENNVSALASLEYLTRCETSFDKFLFVKYGPGVGSSVIISGLHNNTYGGELGHTTLKNSNEKCKCGKIGCLEAEIREEKLLKNYFALSNENLNNIDELYELYERGDKNAKKAVSPMIENLSLTISNMYVVLDKLKITLFGKAFSYSSIKNDFLNSLKSYYQDDEILQKVDFSKIADNTRYLAGCGIAIWNFFLN